MIDPFSIIDRYYYTSTDLYRVLVVHSQHVRDKALEVDAKHPELNLNTGFIAEAAMLHDLGIFLCHAPGIHCHGTHQYIEHGYLGADILRKEGLPRHALVCERHTGMGLSLKTIVNKKLPLPERDMIPESMEEKVICYADKFYSKTKLNEAHSVDHIRRMLANFGKWEVEQFDDWHNLFG